MPIIEVEHLHKRYRDKVLVLTTCETTASSRPGCSARSAPPWPSR
ncbi:MAG TPA: hypothetical protein VFQ49_08140 [Actinomycetes bacterium]|nr:hypothetical protein [Actinomycetes bacterium]